MATEHDIEVLSEDEACMRSLNEVELDLTCETIPSEDLQCLPSAEKFEDKTAVKPKFVPSRQSSVAVRAQQRWGKIKQ